jgi:signal transduction histidine kinase
MTTGQAPSVRDPTLDAVLHPAPLVAFVYDRDGTCIFSVANGPSTAVAPLEVVGANLWDVYADDPDRVERLRRPLRGETYLGTDRVGERTVDTWFLPLGADEEGVTSALGIMVDVTDRTRAQDDLQLYRAFVDAAPQFIALARLDGSVLHVNPGGRRMAGIPGDVDVTTTTIADYLTAEALQASIEVEQPAVVRDGRYEGETALRHWPTGQGIPVRVASFLVTDPVTGAPLALATVQADMTEVAGAREAMQRQVAHQRGLLLHLHKAQEAERQRIAGEIHDDTVQVMAAVDLRLQSVRRSLEPLLPADRLADLDALVLAAREATSRLRRMLVELDPPPATGDDVAAAVELAVQGALHGAQMTSDVVVRISGEPSPIVARTLMRIVREALANVVKHAGAGTVRVELREEPGEYVLRVLDDGRGIRADDGTGPLHRGLRSMGEQADSVGGTFTVTARPEGGTVAEARLPHLLGHPEQALSGPSPRLFLEQVMESISDAYCAIDADWRYVYLNRAGYALLNRDPADSVVGTVIWDEMDITPEFEAAYRRAREDQVPVELVGYYAPWDRWIHNRVLPTAGGLSIFARDVTEERRRGLLVGVGRDVVTAVTGPAGLADALRAALEALVSGWPIAGARILDPHGAVQAEAGDVGGTARRVRLQVSGTPVGQAELFGEVEPVYEDVLQLIALRVAAGRPTDASTDRDGVERAEPETIPARSGGHGPHPS